jgi:putative sigma-54 modulation protein
MRIDVSGKHMDVTDAIREYAEKKCERLPRYYNGVQSIEVVLEQLPKDAFEVEFRVDVEKHDTFVARDRGEDVYGCIDVASDRMTRQLTDFKEKLKKAKRHA